MTIICLKDRKLAWDSHISQGSMKFGSTDSKVRQYSFAEKVYYAGGCGDLCVVQSFQRFLEEMDDDTFEVWSKNPRFNVQRATTFLYNPAANFLCEFQDKSPPVELRLKSGYAIGIGSDYAYGAMDSGKSAAEAVKMVAKRFDGCSEPIYKAVYQPKRK